jgi:hypothetical protein
MVLMKSVTCYTMCNEHCNNAILWDTGRGHRYDYVNKNCGNFTTLGKDLHSKLLHSMLYNL